MILKYDEGISLLFPVQMDAPFYSNIKQMYGMSYRCQHQLGGLLDPQPYYSWCTHYNDTCRLLSLNEL